MNRIRPLLYTALLLCVPAGLGAAQAGAAEDFRAGKAGAVRAPKGIFGNKKGIGGGDVGLARQRLERLSRMTPSERKAVLDQLPPVRRRLAERQLAEYMRMAPGERARILDSYERLQQLPAAKQQAVRRLFAQFNRLPEERRPLVRGELARIRALPADERRAHMNTDEFRNRYTPAEQQLLSDLSAALEPEREQEQDQEDERR